MNENSYNLTGVVRLVCSKRPPIICVCICAIRKLHS